jgi:hypothetical protein
MCQHTTHSTTLVYHVSTDRTFHLYEHATLIVVTCVTLSVVITIERVTRVTYGLIHISCTAYPLFLCHVSMMMSA